MQKLTLLLAMMMVSTLSHAAPRKTARKAAPAKVSRAAIVKRWSSFFDKDAGQLDVPKSLNVSARKLPGAAKATFFRVMKTTDGVIMGSYHDKRTNTFMVADFTEGESDARFQFFNAKGKHIAHAYQTDDGLLNWSR